MSQPITILFSEESHGGGGVLNMDSDGTQLSQECAALSICTPEDTNSFPIIPPPNPHLSKPQKRNKRTRQSRKGYMSPLEDDFKDIPTTCVKKKNKRVPTRLVSPCRGPDFMMYPSPPRSAPFAIVTREMSELSRSSSIMSDGLDRSPKSGSKLAIYTTEFSEHVEIGHGCFGRVMRVRKKTDGMTYAIKISWTPIRGERDQEARLHEVHALAKCDHPNILRYFSSWIEEGFVYLQTEYCAGGCASKKLSSFWSQHNTLQLLMQLSSALEYLHQHKLAHMDVKGENIYLTAKGIYKLGDFGLVAFLDTKQPLEQGLSRNRSLLFSQDSCEGLPRNRSLLFSQVLGRLRMFICHHCLQP